MRFHLIMIRVLVMYIRIIREGGSLVLELIGVVRVKLFVQQIVFNLYIP